ncbi:MAG: HD domain-containing protein [Bacillota bacterium]
MLTEHVTLETLITDSVAKKHLPQGGLRHAVVTAENAFELANQRNLCPDIATKAGLLHDIGHTSWERQGEWDYESYNNYDIHTIKGAERAHELLVLKEEDPSKARKIALAILFHSASSPISDGVELTPVQQLVFDADDMDHLKDKERHTLEIDFAEALERVRRLDMLVYRRLTACDCLCKDCNNKVGEVDGTQKE